MEGQHQDTAEARLQATERRQEELHRRMAGQADTEPRKEAIRRAERAVGMAEQLLLDTEEDMEEEPHLLEAIPHTEVAHRRRIMALRRELATAVERLLSKEGRIAETMAGSSRWSSTCSPILTVGGERSIAKPGLKRLDSLIDVLSISSLRAT